jgi:hypothetical protein
MDGGDQHLVCKLAKKREVRVCRIQSNPLREWGFTVKLEITLYPDCVLSCAQNLVVALKLLVNVRTTVLFSRAKTDHSPRVWYAVVIEHGFVVPPFIELEFDEPVTEKRDHVDWLRRPKIQSVCEKVLPVT